MNEAPKDKIGCLPKPGNQRGIRQQLRAARGRNLILIEFPPNLKHPRRHGSGLQCNDSGMCSTRPVLITRPEFKPLTMKNAFPRLLVATEFPPNAPGGGPAVVRQMLSEWPASQLYWWSCLPEGDRTFGQQVAAHAVAAIPPKLYPQQRWRGQKSWLLERAWVPWAGRHFQRTLRQFQPEAIWVIPHAWAIPALSRVLPDGGIKYHVTVQDFMAMGSYVKRYGPERIRRWTGQAERLYARATTRDATSHPMIAELLARTGQPAAQMLHAGIEPAELAALGARQPKTDGVIRIAHAGTIQVAESFAFFVSTLGRIRTQLPRPVSLEFYGNHSYAAAPWFDATWMREHGSLPAAELTRALSQFDWGFAAMALTDDDPQYNHFSFPTKFISYLAAGLPVITLGHPESSVMKMAAAHPVGIYATTTDAAVLAGQLLTGLGEPDPGMKYLAGIRQCAETEFNARRMRGILYDCFG